MQDKKLAVNNKMVDVSGSVSESELKLIYSHLKAFSKAHKEDIQLDLFFWSSGEVIPERDFIQDIKESQYPSKPFSYGGTYLKVARDFINKQYQNKKILFVNITDTYFDACNLDPNIIQEHYIICTAIGREKDTIEMFKKTTKPLTDIITLRAERSAY